MVPVPEPNHQQQQLKQFWDDTSYTSPLWQQVWAAWHWSLQSAWHGQIGVGYIHDDQCRFMSHPFTYTHWKLNASWMCRKLV